MQGALKPAVNKAAVHKGCYYHGCIFALGSILSILALMYWCIPVTLHAGPCYYAGDSQGGRTAEREETESLIEGHYTDYQVEGLFGDEFVYSRFERDRCSQTV